MKAWQSETAQAAIAGALRISQDPLGKAWMLASLARVLGADWRMQADGSFGDVGAASTVGMALLGDAEMVERAKGWILMAANEANLTADMLRLLDFDFSDPQSQRGSWPREKVGSLHAEGAGGDPTKSTELIDNRADSQSAPGEGTSDEKPSMH